MKFTIEEMSDNMVKVEGYGMSILFTSREEADVFMDGWYEQKLRTEKKIRESRDKPFGARE